MRLPPKNTLLLLVCVAIWSGIMVVGLWPFNFFPKNKAQWLGNKNGIRFEWHGQIYSTGASEHFAPSSASPQDSHTLELWLGPVDKRKRGIIFSMYDPGRKENFTIGQSMSDLLVRARFLDRGTIVARKFYVSDLFEESKARFVTITSDSEGTVVYVDAARAKVHPGLIMAGDNFSGRLILGHSPTEPLPWAGEVLGLAIYDRTLTAQEVVHHYWAWKTGRFSELSREKDAIAVYPFDERTGNLVHNYGAAAPDLLIPAKFCIVHRTFLEPPLEFRKSDLRDFAVNILGFCPFGIFVCAYFRNVLRLRRVGAALSAIALGTLTSIIIEVLQAYLPSRDSTLADVINNSLGTAFGAMLLDPALKLANMWVSSVKRFWRA